MRFCTAINCMDGRVQLPVINYLRNRFDAEYVDSITEPGPILILSERKDADLVQSILRRVDISVEKHKSGGIAVVGHADCAGNPVGKEEQIAQIQSSAHLLRQKYESMEVIGLWVDEQWSVSEVDTSEPT